MGMGTSWAGGIVGKVLASIGGIFTLIGIFVGFAGHGFVLLLIGILLMAVGSYMKYSSKQSVRVVEMPRDR